MEDLGRHLEAISISQIDPQKLIQELKKQLLEAQDRLEEAEEEKRELRDKVNELEEENMELKERLEEARGGKGERKRGARDNGAERSGKKIEVLPDHQRPKMGNALDYLEQVKKEFPQNPEKYNQFLDIMKDFKAQKISIPDVISRVTALFDGHTQLLEGFSQFLPPNYKIETHEHVITPEQTTISAISPSTGPDFDSSRKYVQKVKTRFQATPGVYKSFLEILHSYHAKGGTIQGVRNQVVTLFAGHEDLIEEFNIFLPTEATQKNTNSLSEQPNIGPDPILVLQQQHLDGFWELTDYLLKTVGIDLKVLDVVNEVLIKKGCASMGDDTLQNAKLMVATSLLLAYVLPKIRDHTISPDYMTYVDRGTEWLKKAEEKFPMLAYRLDLGPSWENFANNYLTNH